MDIQSFTSAVAPVAVREVRDQVTWFPAHLAIEG